MAGPVPVSPRRHNRVLMRIRQSTAFAPTWQGACPGTTCSSTFVQVSGINLSNNYGDSGGPWFIGGTAYGIHMGGTLGLGIWSVYTPIARLANFCASLVLLWQGRGRLSLA